MFPLGDEEAFTTLLQKLPEEDKRLLEQFEQNPVNDLGLIDEQLNHLLKVADALGLIEKPDEISSTIKHCMKDPPLYLKPSEVAPYSPTQLLQLFAMIIRRMLMKLAAFPPVPMPPPEIPDHYPHTSVPEHASQVVAEGKFKNKEGEQQPDRLITLKEAAGLYPDDVSYGDVLRWHYSGLLEEKGRRWLARPGGRSIPLVSPVEVAYLKDNRPPRGPTESFKNKMRKSIDSLRK